MGKLTSGRVARLLLVLVLVTSGLSTTPSYSAAAAAGAGRAATRLLRGDPASVGVARPTVAPAEATGCGPTWRSVPTPPAAATNTLLFDVAGDSAGGGWAVGAGSGPSASQAQILQWSGDRWATVPSPSPGTAATLLGVAAIGPSDAWATGYFVETTGRQKVLMLHWDGQSWQRVEAPNEGNGTNYSAGLAAFSPRDVWAVGDHSTGSGQSHTLVLHWDGGRWQHLPTFDPTAGVNTLFGVGGSGPTDVWAVGQIGQPGRQRTFIQHWDGLFWTPVPSPSVGGGDNVLFAVAATTPTDAWATGQWFGDDGTEHALLLHWDGTSWAEMALPNLGPGNSGLDDAQATASGDVWFSGAVRYTGGYPYDPGSGAPLLLHWDGAKLQLARTPAIETPGGGLTGMMTTPAGEVRAVGWAYNPDRTRASLAARICPIRVTDAGFDPASASVPMADTVGWLFPVSNTVPHTLTGGVGGTQFTSGPRPPGSSYLRDFPYPGNVQLRDDQGHQGGLDITSPIAAPRPRPPVLATGAASLIQSDFGRGQEHLNFEAVVLQGHQLVHWWRDNSNVNLVWHRGAVITNDAVGPGCIIQSDFHSRGDEHGNLEVVVLEGTNPDGTHDLVHYWRDFDWHRGLVISHQATGPGCIIQSDFGRGQDHLNFEVVVLEGNHPDGTKDLVHYWHNNSDVTLSWQRALTITTTALGPASLIQSDFTAGDEHHNFEVLVPQGRHADGTFNIMHYAHRNGAATWDFDPIPVSTRATGPATLIQSDYHSGEDHNNFEAFVLEGHTVQHYWRNPEDTTTGWSQGQAVTTRAADLDGQPAFGVKGAIQSDFGRGQDHLNFETLVLQNEDIPDLAPLPATGYNIVHVWHNNSDVHNPWTRGQTVTYTGRSQKICQLTGGFDGDNEVPTVSRTDRQRLLRTDLGFPFEGPGGKLNFLFGDTQDVDDNDDPSGPPNDAWATTTDTSVAGCLHLSVRALHDDSEQFWPLLADPPLAHGGEWPTSGQTEFNVPSSGFSVNGQIYVFFWTHQSGPEPAFNERRGRSVLTRYNPSSGDFDQFLGRSFSTENFVYTFSVVVDAATVPGLPTNSGPGVLVYGTRDYRQSYPRLAFLPAATLDNPATWWYYAPDASGNLWQQGSQHESEAVPVWGEADGSEQCVSEASVGWNPHLNRWIMMYNCDGALIRMRLAARPWGPWSPATTVFDGRLRGGGYPTTNANNPDGGLCRVLHVGIIGDDEFGCDKAMTRDDDDFDQSGGPYAPFIMPRYTTGNATSTTMYFIMSTWRPYQTMVMQMTLEVPPPS